MRDERRIVGGLVVFLWLCASPGLGAQCDTFSGQVAADSSYERSFGDGLHFRRWARPDAPREPGGWIIEVRAGPDGEHDFAMVATPPYRWSNPRHIDTAYGKSALGAVARDVRAFGFVTSEEAYARLSEVMRFLVFSRPAEMTEAEYEAAYDSVYAEWQTMLDGVGKGQQLRITDADVSEPTPDHRRGRIERLAVTVTLCPGGGDPGEPGEPGALDTSRGSEGTIQDGPPGRILRAATPVPVDDVGRSCVGLSSPVPAGADSDSLDPRPELVARACVVADAGSLARTEPLRWHWALYRHLSVYAPTETTPDRDLEFFPDTVREDQLVLFTRTADEDRVRPVWHDRTDARSRLLRPPRSTALGGEGRSAGSPVLFVHRRCLGGTGGCTDHPFRLEGTGTVTALERDYLRALERRLPREWGTWKGGWVDTAGTRRETRIALRRVSGSARRCRRWRRSPARPCASAGSDGISEAGSAGRQRGTS